jgi:hypothetical protein
MGAGLHGIGNAPVPNDLVVQVDPGVRRRLEDEEGGGVLQFHPEIENLGPFHLETFALVPVVLRENHEAVFPLFEEKFFLRILYHPIIHEDREGSPGRLFRILENKAYRSLVREERLCPEVKGQGFHAFTEPLYHRHEPEEEGKGGGRDDGGKDGGVGGGSEAGAVFQGNLVDHTEFIGQGLKKNLLSLEIGYPGGWDGLEIPIEGNTQAAPIVEVLLGDGQFQFYAPEESVIPGEEDEGGIPVGETEGRIFGVFQGYFLTPLDEDPEGFSPDLGMEKKQTYAQDNFSIE